MADADAPPSVNCLMLVTWPERRAMIQQAIASYVQQDYPHRTLTIVNDGDPCALSAAFDASFGGRVVQAARGASIGEKRNFGVRAVPAAAFVASFDDDDLSLPSRLRLHVERIGSAAWLSASRKYIALQQLENIVGFEYGRCYGAGMIRTAVALKHAWPHVSWCEDHQLYEKASADPEFAGRMIEADDLTYVHRRHATNASVAHRKDMWQGVLPLQLGGAEAMVGAAQARSLLGAVSHEAADAYLVDAEAPVAAACAPPPPPPPPSASASSLGEAAKAIRALGAHGGGGHVAAYILPLSADRLAIGIRVR